jgi:hypothetical protein
MPKYQIEFRVRGRGYFPLDMLRYCNAAPRNSDDKASVLATSKEYGVAFFQPREIELVKESTSARAVKNLADDRWRSFGWEVINVRKPYKAREALTIEPLWAEERYE